MQESVANTTSTRPYLIRAIYEWCTDNGMTPYLAVQVDETVRVPLEHVKNDEIILNISFDATSSLKLGNEYIEFKARFSGAARDIAVPVDHVVAIYARETGQGMAFPMSSAAAESPVPGGVMVPTPVPSGAASSQRAPAAAVPPAEEAPSLKLISAEASDGTPEDEPPPPSPRQGGRPALKRVK